jgi:hypothetical protein
MGAAEQGVFRRVFIEQAIKQGQQDGLSYKKRPIQGAYRTLGVDWDKFSAGPNFVVLQKNPQDLTHFQVVYREELPRSQYVLDAGVKKVLTLNEKWKPAAIFVDRGAGELQVEQLQLAGLTNLRGISFKENIEFWDPGKNEDKSVPAKHAMVNIAQWMIEKGLVSLAEEDEILMKQLLLYRIENVTPTGTYVYTSKEDHAIAAFLLALFAMVLTTDNPYTSRRQYADIEFIKDPIVQHFNRLSDPTVKRPNQEPPEIKYEPSGFSYATPGLRTPSRRTMLPPTRRSMIR